MSCFDIDMPQLDVGQVPRHKFFVNCVNLSVNNANYEQNLQKLTHIAKFLRKICILRKSLCPLEPLRYFIANLILSQIYMILPTANITFLWAIIQKFATN